MPHISPTAEALSPASDSRSPGSKSLDALRRLFASRGTATYLVGGAVRDAMAGLPVSDLDLAVEDDPTQAGAEIGKLLGGRPITLHESRSIVRVVGADEGTGPVVDLTPLRGGIVADLARRDFTVDAMALPIEHFDDADIAWRIIDPHGGVRDLAQGVIRAVSPGVFADDPARLMRAPRLAAQLGFDIDDVTAGLIRRDATLIAGVAPERVRDELMKLLEQSDTTRNLRMLDSLGLLSVIIPEIEEAKGVTQPKEHHWDVFDHSVESAGQVEMLLQQGSRSDAYPYSLAPRFESMDAHFAQAAGDGHSRLELLKLTALLHDISKPATRTVEPSGRIRFLGHHEEGAAVAAQVLTRLRFSGASVGLVARMVLHHLRPSQMAEKGALPTPRAIYRYYRAAGDAAIDTLYLNLADYLAARGPDLGYRDWEDHCGVIGHILREGSAPAASEQAPRLIDGHAIMSGFSLPPGAEIGRLIELVMEAQASGEISTEEEALRLVESNLQNGDSGA